MEEELHDCFILSADSIDSLNTKVAEYIIDGFIPAFPCTISLDKDNSQVYLLTLTRTKKAYDRVAEELEIRLKSTLFKELLENDYFSFLYHNMFSTNNRIPFYKKLAQDNYVELTNKVLSFSPMQRDKLKQFIKNFDFFTVELNSSLTGFTTEYNSISYSSDIMGFRIKLKENLDLKAALGLLRIYGIKEVEE